MKLGQVSMNRARSWIALTVGCIRRPMGFPLPQNWGLHSSEWLSWEWEVDHPGLFGDESVDQILRVAEGEEGEER